MEDSFFGFNTSAPLLDNESNNGGFAEPSEEEYDALNDETFGSAINGDWEEAHESMVRLTDNKNHKEKFRNTGQTNLSPVSLLNCGQPKSMPKRSNVITNTDCELNLYGMKLDEADLKYHCKDNLEEGLGEISINLDPSVWSSNSEMASNVRFFRGTEQTPMFGESLKIPSENGFATNRMNYLDGHNLHPVQHQQDIQQREKLYTFSNTPYSPSYVTHHNVPSNISTLEDIERNLITQRIESPRATDQFLSHQNKKSHEQLNFTEPTFTESNHLVTTKYSHQKVPQTGSTAFGGPHKSTNNSSNNISPQSLSKIMQQQSVSSMGSRVPPGFSHHPTSAAPKLSNQGHSLFPQRPLLSQHSLQINFSQPHQRPLNNPHLPIALNNFAMHPNFNVMRAGSVTSGVHPAGLLAPMTQARVPALPTNTGLVLNQQSSTGYNMFNMRLVQEIQMNHPMLQNNIRTQNIPTSISNHYQRNLAANKSNSYRREGGSSTGNLPVDEFDEYSNLMSTRDKHWLIGIQLSQLNTDTPYIDDYYYIVYRERKAALSGKLQHSQAHKDNQLNHPLTQPRGHAQLVLVQLGNKNSSRNSQVRDRLNSENICTTNNTQDQKNSYIFTPLTFENSLGKLQYGSVTAPRKIIDADIMQTDSIKDDYIGNNMKNSKNNSKVSILSYGEGDVFTEMALITLRRSRHILLQIETLYRILLKLEDLDNPKVIATILMKKQKEVERLAMIEQIESATKPSEERVTDNTNSQSVNTAALRNKFVYEVETRDVLLSKLVCGLNLDKIIAMMSVRKGKVLLRRIMPYISEHEIRWTVWVGIFSSLQNINKKDREDPEEIMFALYPELVKQIVFATFEVIEQIVSSITFNEKKSNGLFCSKFGISSLVCLIVQAEKIFELNCDVTLNEENKNSWRNFLSKVANTLNRTIQTQNPSIAVHSEAIELLIHHLARFEDLNLDSLFSLIRADNRAKISTFFKT